MAARLVITPEDQKRLDDLDDRLDITADDQKRLDDLDAKPRDVKLRPKKIELIHDYFRVIILQRQIYISEKNKSLTTDLKFNISLPTLDKLQTLNDEEIDALLDDFTAYEKLKQTDKNLVSPEHNKFLLKINNIVTKPTAGGKKRTRRKRAKRRTRR